MSHSQHEAIQAAFDHVDLRPDTTTRQMEVSTELGFIVLHDGMSQSIIGFGVMPEWQGEMHPPQRTNETRFSEYPKGVGYRLTNTPQASLQPRRNGQQPPLSAVEVIDLDPTAILDVRKKGAVQHVSAIARHASLLVQSRLIGDRSALDRVEREYGDSDAVLMNVPPSVLDEQRLLWKVKEYALDPAMLLVRDRHVTVRRIGEVNMHALTSKD